MLRRDQPAQSKKATGGPSQSDGHCFLYPEQEAANIASFSRAICRENTSIVIYCRGGGGEFGGVLENPSPGLSTILHYYSDLCTPSLSLLLSPSPSLCLSLRIVLSYPVRENRSWTRRREPKQPKQVSLRGQRGDIDNRAIIQSLVGVGHIVCTGLTPGIGGCCRRCGGGGGEMLLWGRYPYIHSLSTRRRELVRAWAG